MSVRVRRLSRVVVLLLVALAAVATTAATASAAPLWSVMAVGGPTDMAAGSTNGQYMIGVTNIGESASAGEVTVTDTLPAGVTTSATPTGHSIYLTWSCTSGAGNTTVKCTTTQPIASAPGSVYATSPEAAGPASPPVIRIPVDVSSGASGSVTNRVSVSGGGAPASASASASASQANVISSEIAAFGVENFGFNTYDEDGALDMDAGGHPYALTTKFSIASEVQESTIVEYPGVEHGEREVVVDLPLGLVGDPQAAPQCPEYLMQGYGSNQSLCPPDTQVGVLTLVSPTSITSPYSLFNLVPPHGYAAQFGLNYANKLAILDASVVHTAAGYVVRVTAPIPALGIVGASVTFFSDPGAVFAPAFSTKEKEEAGEVPFLTNPVACSTAQGALQAMIYADSWDFPGPVNAEGAPELSSSDWASASAGFPTVEGCGALSFDPSLSMAPGTGTAAAAGEAATTQADEPSAYAVNLQVPQTEKASEPATPELRTATVTLPAGLGVSPSAAAGLEGCAEAQLDVESEQHGSCPPGSRIGTVEVETPLLAKEADGTGQLKGYVYLAEPTCGGAGQPACSEALAEEGKVFGIYIEVEDPTAGVVVKLPGRVEAGGSGAHSVATGLAQGQLRAVFEENPQLPFNDLKLSFFGGPRAPLANPQTCGTFATVSDLEPWSAPETPTKVSESPFQITGCGASMPFAPGFTAGTASAAAGGYSNFSAVFSRNDGEQDLSGVTVNTPPGLLGKIAGVPRCGEAEANAGTCSEASQIGTTSVQVGPGTDPYTVTGGRVYLTGPYKSSSTGAEGPFGLSIVVPAVAGPFNLGNVVVRASIEINPTTSALTIVSSPLPQYVDGVQLRVRKVDVEVNRPDFMLNATDCTEQSIGARITAAQGASASLSSPYAPSGCAKLPFKPRLTASVAGRASKADGASFDVKLESAGVGQANIHAVDLQLPKDLPSRLTTLHKACTEAVFNANPAACDAGSVIGKATIHTPLLDSPLSGPAYLVSHGGAAFPDVEFVLQGEGVKLVLDGKTDIKAGITYSRFEATPDAPFTTFETELPAGPHSILTANVPAKANYSLCGTSLTMPTTLTGQNGARIKQSTKVAVTGCAKAKALTRAQKLAKALKQCRKNKKRKKRRVACEKQARRHYGAKKTKKSTHGKGRK